MYRTTATISSVPPAFSFLFFFFFFFFTFFSLLFLELLPSSRVTLSQSQGVSLALYFFDYSRY